MARQPPKCCCCVPLRPGLLAWAYIKLVLALTSIGVFVYSLRHKNFDRIDYMSRNRSPVVYVFEQLWPLGVCLLLVFTIIFAIGVHRQSYKLLLVFLVYSLLEVILASAVVAWQVYDLVSSLWCSYYSRVDSEMYVTILWNRIHDPVFYLPLIVPVVINMLLPMYLIVLIKSEVHRLQTARAETRVVLDIPVTKEQDKI